MSDLDMYAAKPTLDLSNAPLDVITIVLHRMSLSDRLTCALVCKDWAVAATAATRSIILEHRVDMSCLQRWLEKHGAHLEVFQLHQCHGAVLTALPCPQLQDLLLWGSPSLDSRAWTDIAAATKLTSVSLSGFNTAAKQADVVSALTALPDLQQLTWCFVKCNGVQRLSDSLLLKQASQLTALKLAYVSKKVLEHLGCLTKLQDLNIATTAEDWAAAGCPGLQELKALTRLRLGSYVLDLPANISQLTALQQLDVWKVTPTALSRLQALTGLTQLVVTIQPGLSPESSPLQLTGLQHLKLAGSDNLMPMSYLERCTQLRVLSLGKFAFTGPGSLVTSTSLEHLRLFDCVFKAAAGAADPETVSWQQVFPGPGRLPHLTSLELPYASCRLGQADMELLVATCSNIQVLRVDTIQVSFAPAVVQLSGLTSLHLKSVDDEQCGVLAQLTGLRELRTGSSEVSLVGLRQLAALEQLTSLGFCNPSSRRLELDWLEEHMSDSLPSCFHAIINKAPAGHPSDVSTRLMKACNMAPAAGH